MRCCCSTSRQHRGHWGPPTGTKRRVRQGPGILLSPWNKTEIHWGPPTDTKRRERQGPGILLSPWNITNRLRPSKGTRRCEWQGPGILLSPWNITEIHWDPPTGTRRCEWQGPGILLSPWNITEIHWDPPRVRDGVSGKAPVYYCRPEIKQIDCDPPMGTMQCERQGPGILLSLWNKTEIDWDPPTGVSGKAPVYYCHPEIKQIDWDLPMDTRRRKRQGPGILLSPWNKTPTGKRWREREWRPRYIIVTL